MKKYKKEKMKGKNVYFISDDIDNADKKTHTKQKNLYAKRGKN